MSGELKILDADLLDDGCIIVHLNEKHCFNSKQVMLTPELVLGLVEAHGRIPPKEDTDFPGIPIVDFEDVFEEEGDEDGEGGESGKEEE